MRIATLGKYLGLAGWVVFAHGAFAAAPARPWDAERYEIRTALDPAHTETFVTETRATLRSTTHTNVVDLDAVELKALAVELVGAPAAPTVKTTGTGWHITLPRAVDAGATITLVLRAEGKVAPPSNQYGLFRSRPLEPGGKVVLATQFEADGARRFFPCVDRPDDKATFHYWLTAPMPSIALASGQPTHFRDLTIDGRPWREFEFDQPIPHSTYVVGIAVGEFATIQRDEGNVPVSIWFTGDKRKAADVALETTRTALRSLEHALGLPYPWGKLAVIGIPHFTISGMENVSSIFLDERILFGANSSSEDERRETSELIAHEIAHHWFGNWVTIADWRDLWLKEGFATLYGQRFTQLGFGPEVADLQLVENLWDDAFPQDEGPRAHALVTEGLPSLADAYDDTNYLKGAAFLRMLEGSVGTNAFVETVRAYLTKHAKSTATHDDFLAALGARAKRDLTLARDTWLRQPGHPIVSYTARWNAPSKTLTLAIRQSPSSAAAKKPFWFRLQVLVHTAAGEHTEPIEMSTATLERTIPLPAAPDWIVLNHAASTVAEIDPPDDENLPAIARAAKDPIDRYWAARELVEDEAWEEVIPALETEPSYWVRASLLQTLLNDAPRPWPKAFSARVFALGSATPVGPPGAGSFRTLWIQALGALDDPRAAATAESILDDPKRTREAIVAAARAVALRAAPTAPATLERALARYRDRGEEWRVPLELSFAAWENPGAAARIAQWLRTDPDLLGKLGGIVERNLTLKPSTAWLQTLVAIAVDEEIDEDARAGLLQTIEDVDPKGRAAALRKIERSAKSARIRELARRMREFKGTR